MPEPAAHGARTADGRFRVHIYRNQTAELCEANGRVLVERARMYVIIRACSGGSRRDHKRARARKYTRSCTRCGSSRASRGLIVRARQPRQQPERTQSASWLLGGCRARHDAACSSPRVGGHFAFRRWRDTVTSFMTADAPTGRHRGAIVITSLQGRRGVGGSSGPLAFSPSRTVS
jgi:hypothetical protein